MRIGSRDHGGRRCARLEHVITAAARAGRRARGPAARAAPRRGRRRPACPGSGPASTRRRRPRGQGAVHRPVPPLPQRQPRGQRTRPGAARASRSWRNWEQQDLDRLRSKIRDTMPPDDPGKLSEDDYVGLVSYILQANGYPAGSDAAGGRSAERASSSLPQAGRRARAAQLLGLVQVVGCLSQGSDRSWVLTRASEPALTRDRPSNAEELKRADARPLGAQTFQLVSVSPFQPDAHAGPQDRGQGALVQVAGHEPRERELAAGRGRVQRMGCVGSRLACARGRYGRLCCTLFTATAYLQDVPRIPIPSPPPRITTSSGGRRRLLGPATSGRPIRDLRRVPGSHLPDDLRQLDGERLGVGFGSSIVTIDVQRAVVRPPDPLGHLGGQSPSGCRCRRSTGRRGSPRSATHQRVALPAGRRVAHPARRRIRRAAAGRRCGSAGTSAFTS